MTISRSRFTPGLENGADVDFKVGETVKYKLRSGLILDIKIITEMMLSKDAPGEYGYDAIFSDDGCRYFAIKSQIIDWEGKDRSSIKYKKERKVDWKELNDPVEVFNHLQFIFMRAIDIHNCSSLERTHMIAEHLIEYIDEILDIPVFMGELRE